MIRFQVSDKRGIKHTTVFLSELTIVFFIVVDISLQIETLTVMKEIYYMVENRCVFISWVSENKTKERDTYDCMGGGTSKLLFFF